MLFPIKVIDIELTQPIPTLEGLEDYMGLRVLVRLHGTPLGHVKAKISNGRCTAETLTRLILDEFNWEIICQSLRNGLVSQRPSADAFTLDALLDLPAAEYAGEWPLVTVAVCTRDRPEDIKLCLDAIQQLDYPRLDILVVGNAPKTTATKDLIDTDYPQVRYVEEPRPGLDWARNRAAIEAKGEIIAYTDDDVVVDPNWAKSLAQIFVESPEVMAVTGLVEPYELETEAQVLFEEQGGFGRGVERKWHRVAPNEKMHWGYFAPGRFGTGANMAYRTALFSKIGYFDPALDVGTVTNGGGDLEMFFRTLKEGYTLVYEPAAIVKHRHRKDYKKLRSQLQHNGAIIAHLVRTGLHYPGEMLLCIRTAVWWMQYLSWFLAWSYLSPARLSPDLVWPQIGYSFKSLFTYFKARKIAKKISAEFGPLTPAEQTVQKPSVPDTVKNPVAIAVRTVELSESPLQPIEDVTDYSTVRVFTTWNGSAIGHVDIDNKCQPIGASRLCSAIVETIELKLLRADETLSRDMRYSLASSALRQRYGIDSADKTTAEHLPDNVKVSVVVATLDRPDDLQNCLRQLSAQRTEREVEIVVIDNNPDSGLTPPVVANFPDVVLVNESRRGLAYARNAGFTACTGEIAIATDDDVTVPLDWVEKISAPFCRQDVMVVTSNVMPIEMETYSQRLFEEYADGGLGRGFERFEANGDWFNHSWRRAVPTWRLGATANAAFRCSIFKDPTIGLMNEALGPGMPSGVGEDIYVFYKVLKAGYTVVYEPKAGVFHKHRQTMASLHRQLKGYSKGIISYHITTLIKDGDQRAIGTVLLDIPVWHAGRMKDWLLGNRAWPMGLHLVEIRSCLVAPWALWRSYARVKREGHSAPYLPISQRPQIIDALTKQDRASGIKESVSAL